ncbi:hypothetical protein PV08_06373 [Exophiala spinifera]|uniref:AAA+ ATPase domain-containing protein n=1 Tax=Exophiala spinifera TaxID=91928 RepID=A0A0D1ZU51_9EURO|nr:uncharacterized protein PV08_06373 [Exophiala spinifera]KIW16322.1 hypothetical protein PV08_06373 [Exophiala spinifera]
MSSIAAENHATQKPTRSLHCEQSSSTEPTSNGEICRNCSESSALSGTVTDGKLKQRIGRRKEEGGEVKWISQLQWEDEQSQLKATNGFGNYAFCLDDSNDKNKIVISSPALVGVVRRVIPARLFENVSDGVTITEPFLRILHFIDDMRNDMDLSTADPQESVDIDALETFLFECQPQHKVARGILSITQPAMVNFEMIWALFKESDLIMVTDKFKENRIFKFTHLEENVDRMNGRPDVCVKLAICGWCIAWDIEQKSFSQQSYKFYIERFLGYRNVRTLPIYPLRCEEEKRGDSLKAELEKRGRKWAHFASQAPCCFEYSGTAIHTNDYGTRISESVTQLSGRIIIDHVKEVSLRGTFDTEVDHNRRAILEEKLDDTPTGTSKMLTKAEHYLLCTPTLTCFHIDSWKRYHININKLKPVVWVNNAIEKIIIEETKKKRLKRLVKNYISEGMRGGDIITNKGRGLTIVLYGPSGVGKTLTAECLAEYVKMPLLPLSVGSLVSDDDLIEENLREAFNNASRLKAILLLDEADVVLEARSFEDVRRNGIVSIFLRQLEYYDGILFLTTNRITTMDVAFQSRIQLAISYEELSADTREKIWRSLLNTAIVDVTESEKSAIERAIPGLSQEKLNGRQIRNTLTQANLLALDDFSSECKVQLKHIKEAMYDTLQFQAFFEGAGRNQVNKPRVWIPFTPSQSGV